MKRYTLDLQDFARLVRGKPIQAGDVELLLADVGWDELERQLATARRETAAGAFGPGAERSRDADAH